MRATQRVGLTGRGLLVAVLAAACAVVVAQPHAAAQEREGPGLGDLLAPLSPDDEEDEAPPATVPPEPAEPDPAPGPPPDPNEAPPPPGGEPPPDAAPPAGDVQGAQAAPRRPTSGSASGPGLQPGGPLPGESGAELPMEVAPPSVAPPDLALPEAAPPADGATGQEMASQLLVGGSGAPLSEPAMPDLTVLGLLALGLMWFDRRYRARYRLPPQ